MEGQTHGIDAQVMIKAAAAGRPGQRQPDVLDDKLLGKYLRSITVTNSIDQPYGTFQIEFSPESVRLPSMNPTPLAELIQPYSLVSIALHRSGRGAACTPKPVPIMLGVVDEPTMGEDWQDQEPRRTSSIQGRSLTGVLTDHRWWFHHFLAYAGALKLPPDLREFFAERPTDVLLRDEASLRTLGFFAIDEKLFDLSNRDPVSLMDTAWRFFVEGTADRGPFIKNRWDGRPISDYLRFDVDAARQSYFDPAARLISQFLPTEMPDASCWDLLKYFSEEHFTELFSDTYGDSLEAAHIRVVSRKPPFAGHIVYPGGQARVNFSVGTKQPRYGQSLFDSTYGAWDRDAETVYVDGSDVLGIPQLERGIDEGCFSLYSVLPAAFKNAGAGVGDQSWQQEIPPIVDEVLDSPSFIERIGIRPMEVQVYSIAVLDAATNEIPVADIRHQCLAYALLLREWHFRRPELWRGTYQLKGRTALRAGKRLVDRREDGTVWEFYIRSVVHRITFDEQPFYSTTVQVERGWQLDGGAK